MTTLTIKTTTKSKVWKFECWAKRVQDETGVWINVQYDSEPSVDVTQVSDMDMAIAITDVAKELEREWSK